MIKNQWNIPPNFFKKKKKKQKQNKEPLFCGMTVGLWVDAGDPCFSTYTERVCPCLLLQWKWHPLTFLFRLIWPQRRHVIPARILEGWNSLQIGPGDSPLTLRSMPHPLCFPPLLSHLPELCRLSQPFPSLCPLPNSASATCPNS